MNETYRTCPECGTVNLNRDYCKDCGTIININLKRTLEREQKAVEKQQLQKPVKRNAIAVFFEEAREHSNPFIQYTARFFYSIWVVVIAIGSFLAMVFGYIAA